MIFWTSEVTDALKKGAIAEYEKPLGKLKFTGCPSSRAPGQRSEGERVFSDSVPSQEQLLQWLPISNSDISKFPEMKQANKRPGRSNER